jgi:hypothetical protein
MLGVVVLLALATPATAPAQAGAGMAGWIGSSGPVPRSTSRPEGPTDPTAREVERRLRAAGFSPGPVDGVLDGKTHRAIRRFQRSRGIESTGELDALTRTALWGATGGGAASSPPR